MKKDSAHEVMINSEPWTTISTKPAIYDSLGKRIKINWKYYAEHIFDEDQETTEQIAIHLIMNNIVLERSDFYLMTNLLKSIKFVVGKEKNFKLQKITPRNIGFKTAPKASDFYEKAFEMGFNPCPSYVGLYFCVGDNLVGIPEYIRFASAPICGDRCIALASIIESNKKRHKLIFDYYYGEQIIHLDFPHVFVVPDYKQRGIFIKSNFRNKYYPNVGNRYPVT